jgi:hypothetical protein
MVALGAAGDVDAEFLVHRRHVTSRRGGQTVIVQKGISGMGAGQTTQCTQGFDARHSQEEHSVLTMDRLRCHRNDKVRDVHIEPFLLSPQVAKLVSP